MHGCGKSRWKYPHFVDELISHFLALRWMRFLTAANIKSQLIFSEVSSNVHLIHHNWKQTNNRPEEYRKSYFNQNIFWSWSSIKRIANGNFIAHKCSPRNQMDRIEWTWETGEHCITCQSQEMLEYRRDGEFAQPVILHINFHWEEKQLSPTKLIQSSLNCKTNHWKRIFHWSIKSSIPINWLMLHELKGKKIPIAASGWNEWTFRFVRMRQWQIQNSQISLENGLEIHKNNSTLLFRSETPVCVSINKSKQRKNYELRVTCYLFGAAMGIDRMRLLVCEQW